VSRGARRAAHSRGARGAALVEPARSRGERRADGAFYTPRWLAEHLLDAVGYRGAAVLDGVLLDPTCGAGQFLVLAAERYRAAAARAGWTPRRVRAGLARAIVGVERDPLAVAAARQNLDRVTGGVVTTLHVADVLIDPPKLPRARWLVGNPPWLRWSALPATYRARIAAACAGTGVVPSSRFGGAELDLAAVIVHVAAAEWLAADGALGFVLPQGLLQSPAARGFRRFVLADRTPLRVLGVDDWSDVRPWSGVAARPASVIARAGSVTTYPVPYRMWRRRDAARIAPTETWAAARSGLVSDPLEATPIGDDARWAVTAPGVREVLDAIAGADPHHRGRKGITTDLNGAYFVRVLSRSGDHLDVEAVPARTPVRAGRFSIESSLVYPLLKGAAEVRAFEASGDLAVIVPNRTIGVVSDPGLPPRARRHFARFRAKLEARSTWRTRMPDAPYWAIYNVGPYTFAPWKVVWAEQARGLAAAVVGERVVGVDTKPVVPDHKIYFVPFDDPEPAHYLCALLNAPCVRAAIDAFTVKLQVGTLFQHVHLPPYVDTDPVHRALAACRGGVHPGEHDRLARDALGLGGARR
jgi:hypothetical protein